MPSPRFAGLLRQLRDLGVAPEYADRLCTELRDHYEDLEDEALRAAKTPLAASAEARLRLGEEHVIAREFARRPELKLWVYRSRLLFVCLRAVSWGLLALRALTAALVARRAAFARFGVAAASAAVMTMALLLVLQISLGTRKPLSSPAPVVADSVDIVFEHWAAPEELVVRAKPTKREPAEQPERVEVASAENVQIRLSVDGPSPIGAPHPQMELAMVRLPDGEYFPVARVAPVFPQRAAARGLEGYVVLEYTVTPTGAVENVIVVESSDDIFEESAIHAIQRFKYKPRIVEGRPVHVHGVRTRVSFELEV